MDSVLRDVFATCDYCDEDVQTDIAIMRLEDEPNVEILSE